MSLSEEINNQYSKRNYSDNKYDEGYYVEHVRKEFTTELDKILKEYQHSYDNLTLLEIGAGNGKNALVFEKIGFSLNNISFNELLESRIVNIKSNFPNNTLFEGDAMLINTTEKYDIVFQSTVFTSILSDRDRQKLASKMWSLLKPNGVILWYDFIYNNPKNKDVKKVTVDELHDLFPQSKKHSIKKITLAPPIGRKIGRYCSLFNFSFLRTHILAVIQK